MKFTMNKRILGLSLLAVVLLNGGCIAKLDYNYRNGNKATAWYPIEPAFVGPLSKTDAINPKVLADMDNAVKGVVFTATAPVTK